MAKRTGDVVYNKLTDLRETVKSGLRHRGMNLAVLFFGLLFGLLFLLLFFDKQQGFLPTTLAVMIRNIMMVIATYFVASVVIRLTADLPAKLLSDAEIEQKLLFRKAYIGLIYAVASIVLLWRLGLNMQNITILIGFMATGFAFAVRDVILAYFAWYVLLVKRPFRIGDHIRIEEQEGKVLHIGTFFVLLDNSPQSKEDYIRVPGRKFLEEPVINAGPGDPPCSLKVPVQKVPAAFEKLRARVIGAVRKETGVAVSVGLDADADGPMLSVSFHAPYEKRGMVKDAVLLALAKEKLLPGR